MHTLQRLSLITLMISSTLCADNSTGLSPSMLPFSVLEQLDNGTEIRNGGFGSAMTAHPNHPDRFYALTDRGPNAKYTGPQGKGKKFPMPAYTPKISEYRLNKEGSVEMIREIQLKDSQGNRITGLPNPAGMGSTGEVPYDNNGKVLKTDPFGLDSEGLVALKDGSFWVSDEYGPHIVHYNAAGVELERINPFGTGTGGRKLPAVLANRRANRGMEGLAITPDEKTLVGIMQSTLFNPSKSAISNKNLTRILTFDIATGETHQYLYRQEANSLSNSEIAAISNTEFLVIERDGGFYGSNAQYKRLYKIDLRTASDVSGDFSDPQGLRINERTLEQNSWAELASANIQPVTKTLVADVLNDIQYPHDKLEGIWIRNSTTVGLLNDDDFAVSANGGEVIQKRLPADDSVDSNRLYMIQLDSKLY
ncbi:esterase-like activity of phytase family protein [Aestuariirhabdus sp. Z084]|uniref:esterase-like activity of phytase family protein n=1 Tax=Aestuariirhabdus haliotis TaxID=2918751 RepID=UPI00201B3F64|nr:esterase-like activity of phytase family protein [Aestuariirhabdus haliotis]MCL6416948.1 esterase-like activity of phytase family protein [Aestuariirhabdus haliotis]MCL6420949.1 esterase-like activity of phytase family protein [Aestuariirhabdus haliotis]